MKFGQQKNFTIKEKLIYSLIIGFAIVYCWSNYNQTDLQEILEGIITFFVLSFALDMRFWRNQGKPLFEIKDDVLVYKNYWGSIKEYPLINFKGKIETRKILCIEEHLMTPKLTDNKDSLYIGVLDKSEREKFLNCLEEKIYSLEKIQ